MDNIMIFIGCLSSLMLITLAVIIKFKIKRIRKKLRKL